MSVKRATIQDLESAAALFDLYRVFYKQTSDLSGAHAYLKERLEREQSVIFLAYDHNEAVGIAQLYPLFSSISMQRTWLLNDLYVKESARNKGFGKSLIDAVIQFAKETGAKGISLETGEDNLGAQRLYERIGFIRESNYFYFLPTLALESTE